VQRIFLVRRAAICGCIGMLCGSCLVRTGERASRGGKHSALAKWRVCRVPEPGAEGFPSIPERGDDPVWMVALTNRRVVVRRSTALAVWGRREWPRFDIPLMPSPEAPWLPPAAPRRAFRVAGGWLIAYGTLEMPRGLWWFSEGGMDSYRVSVPDAMGPVHVIGLVRNGPDLYALCGTVCWSSESGAIWRLVQRMEDHRWEARPFAVLQHCPCVAAPYGDGSLVVATGGSVEAVSSDGRTELVLGKVFWPATAITSIVADSEGQRAYVGLSTGIAKIALRDPGKGRVLWLCPPKGRRTESKRERGKEGKGSQQSTIEAGGESRDLE